MTYAAMALMGVTNQGATPASGIVTFATAFPTSGAPVVTQPVAIPASTLVQTTNGNLFQTLVASLLVIDTVSVDVMVQAVVPGSAGNAVALAVSGQPLTALGYPLFVQNAAPLSGGNDAETPSQAAAQFAATVGALGLASPVAVANAPIGLSVSGETVRYAACYEPWVAAGSGAGSGTAGFTLYIDNGTGTASATLLTAVTSYINGSTLQNLSGYRPAGVPYTITSGTPVYATVTVSGTLLPGLVSSTTVANAVVSGVQSYFSTLGFGVAAQQPQIAGQAANAGLGFFTSLSVSLYYSGGGGAVTQVTGAANNRIILSSLTVNIGTAS